MSKKTKVLSLAAILLAAVLWGTIGVFTRYFNSIQAETMELISTRAIITSLVLLVIILILDWRLLKIRVKDLWIFLGTGILSYTFFNLCYLESIAENSLSVAAILLYTAPIWVNIASVPLFQDKMTKKKAGCLFLVMCGCVMVSLSGSIAMTGKGLLLGLGSGLGYACYTLFGRVALNRGYHSLTIAFYTFLVVACFTIPLSEAGEMIYIFSTRESSVMLVGMALCSMILPYIFYNLGLKNIRPSVVSMISTIEPVTASILGLLVFHEALGIVSWIGIVLVLGAICLLNTETADDREN